MNDSVKQLTFGVAFSNKFKILDTWGEIADDILYKNKKYFSSDFFTNISSQYTTERRLFNPEKNHLLLLTSNNLIFTQTIEGNYEDEYQMFKRRVSEYLVPNILSKYILVVKRLGIVYMNSLSQDQIKKFATQYFNPTVQNIMDFRFSKKEPTKKGMVISDNSDFINKIFTVGNIGEDIQGISYDYQLHFSPLREDVRNCIDNFINQADFAFTTDVLSGLEVKK